MTEQDNPSFNKKVRIATRFVCTPPWLGGGYGPSRSSLISRQTMREIDPDQSEHGACSRADCNIRKQPIVARTPSRTVTSAALPFRREEKKASISASIPSPQTNSIACWILQSGLRTLGNFRHARRLRRQRPPHVPPLMFGCPRYSKSSFPRTVGERECGDQIILADWIFHIRRE